MTKLSELSRAIEERAEVARNCGIAFDDMCRLLENSFPSRTKESIRKELSDFLDRLSKDTRQSNG